MLNRYLALLFMTAILVAFASYPAQAQDQPLAIPTKGLVSYWTFDEVKDLKVEDIVGDNDGILQDKQKVVKGKYGNALAFDGVRDFIILDAEKLPQGNSAISISVWIFKEKKGHPDFQFLAQVGPNDCCNISFAVLTFSGKRRVNNRIQGAGLMGPEMEMGKWQHVGAVYNGAKKYSLYVDGVEVGTKEVDFEPDIQPGPIPGKQGVGATIGASTRHNALWDGLMDEVAIYNVGLTAADVQRLFNTQEIFAVDAAGKLSLV